MNLYTECFWDGWDKIVDIYTDKYDSFPDYINDEGTYKIVILEKGIIEGENGTLKGEVKAPAVLLLSQSDKASCRIIKPIKAYIIFFKPTAIRDEFTFDRIDSGEFEKTKGQMIHQDYLLVKNFNNPGRKTDRYLPISVKGLKHLKDLTSAMNKQLRRQKDGYWPCRSRSFLIEILHFISYSFCVDDDSDIEDESENAEQELFSEIVQYLEQHLGDTITLGKLTRKFAINRNMLNDIFMKQASMTCMNYLLNLRMDLAKIMLTKTELPISEIGSRVGFSDFSYFTKVFKEQTGSTPSQYREM